MKILKLTSENLKFWKNINLLDGQKRGEVIFRRIFFLLAMGMVLYFILLAVVGKKEDTNLTIDATPEEVQAQEIVKDKEEWVDGDRVTIKADGVVEVVSAEVFMESSVTAIKRFTESYRGSRIDDKYFALLDKYCSDEALRTVVALSVAETGMGRDVKRQSNFYGWFKGGNRNYDPSQETMAKEICNGVEKNYIGIGNSPAKQKKYVGYVSTTWLNNYRWAYNQMEVK